MSSGSLAETLAYCFFNLWVLVLAYQALALFLHCFWDDTIVISKKRTLQVFCGDLLIDIGAIFALPLAFIVGYVGGAISAKQNHPIDYAAIFDIYAIIVSIPLYLFHGAMIACKKGIGIKKTLPRMLVGVIFFFPLTSACGLPAELIRYTLSETGVFGKHLMELRTVELIPMEISRCGMLLLIILVLYFRFYKKGVALRLRKSDILAFTVYAVIVYMLSGFYSELEEENISLAGGRIELRVILTVVILLLVILIPVLIIRNRLSAYYKELTAHQQNFLETELNAARQYKAAQEDTRAFRHDVQNNLTVVSMLMQEGRTEEAERYLNDMRTEVSALSPKVVSGDDMVDSLISSKLAKMSELGIQFSLDGVIDGGLNWKPMDICTVFANLLDNAIEAAAQTENGFLRLECKKSGHHRLIRASNSCAEDVDCDALMSGGSHMTSKKDKALHGYGIGNIRKTVEKYGGMMNIACADQIFTMELMLMK